MEREVNVISCSMRLLSSPLETILCVAPGPASGFPGHLSGASVRLVHHLEKRYHMEAAPDTCEWPGRQAGESLAFCLSVFTGEENPWLSYQGGASPSPGSARSLHRWRPSRITHPREPQEPYGGESLCYSAHYFPLEVAPCDQA